MPLLKQTARSFAILLWAMGIVVGITVAFAYQYRPAESAIAPERWPATSSCMFASDCATLVMFLHPHCVCSRASLHELAALLARWPGRFNAQLIFINPTAALSNGTCTELWNSAAKISGVTLRVDDQGTEQRHFRARVSGEVFVYAPSGSLLYHGGITAGRGHVGDNPGREALESLLLQDQPTACVRPVFGCELSSCRAN